MGYGRCEEHRTLTGEVSKPKNVYAADYEQMKNLPSFNGVEIKGNLTMETLGFEPMTEEELKTLVDTEYEKVFGGDQNG